MSRSPANNSILVYNGTPKTRNLSVQEKNQPQQNIAQVQAAQCVMTGSVGGKANQPQKKIAPIQAVLCVITVCFYLTMFEIVGAA